MPTFGPIDAAAGVAYAILTHLTEALHPIGAAAAIAIVLFTAAVRLLLVPLSRRQIAAQEAQARLAPRLKELTAAHAGDPAGLRRELADVYVRAGANPFGPLLLALLQAPVFLVLYNVFTSPTVGGQVNQLLTADLLGFALGASGLAAGWPLLAVLGGIAAVATFSALRIRRAGQPAWLMLLPYLTLIPAAIMPLAAGLYLLTTLAWSAAEITVFRRDQPD